MQQHTPLHIVSQALPFGWVLSLLITSSNLFAGPLDGHPDAVNGATGSQTISASLPLGDIIATIEYAVLTADDFNNDFAGLGYIPTPGELVYAYQLFNDPGSAGDIWAQQILAGDSANNIGTFDIGDVDSFSEAFTVSDEAEWIIVDVVVPRILPGESSYGLAFSSPNAPVLDLTGSVTSFVSLPNMSVVASVHVPGDQVFIPEPSTFALAALGLLGGGFSRRKRK